MIPAQAVEAAAKITFEGLYELDPDDGWECLTRDDREPYLRQARAALEAAAPYMQADRKSLAEVLSGHQIQQGNRGMTPRCTCGWLGQVFGNDFHKDFITHQADMLTVALRTPNAN